MVCRVGRGGTGASGLKPNAITAWSCPHSIWNQGRHEAGYWAEWSVVWEGEGLVLRASNLMLSLHGLAHTALWNQGRHEAGYWAEWPVMWEGEGGEREVLVLRVSSLMLSLHGLAHTAFGIKGDMRRGTGLNGLSCGKGRGRAMRWL